MKIVMISDTHNRHNDLVIPDGDMIIHAGDATSVGTLGELKDFLYWYAKLPHKYKVFIAGNHDWGMDGDNQVGYEKFCFRRYRSGTMNLAEIEKEIVDLAKQLGLIYLKSSGVEIEGIKIWGSPVQPEFCGWAFNQYTKGLKAEWAKIPLDTNILVTHGPPYGIFDECQDGHLAGCPELSERITHLHNLRLHVYGHIHEDRGMMRIGMITYVNASSLNLRYQPQRTHAFVMEYKK